MTGKLKKHDVDAIYEAAIQRSRHLRWAPWPDLRPSRRKRGRQRRSFLFLLSSIVVLLVGCAVYAANTGWFRQPMVPAALRSLALVDQRVTSAPGFDTIPEIVVPPGPEGFTVPTDAVPTPPGRGPVLAESPPPATNDMPTVAEAAPALAVLIPAPPDVMATLSEPAPSRSKSAVANTLSASKDTTPRAPESAAASSEPAPDVPATAAAASLPDVQVPAPAGTDTAPETTAASAPATPESGPPSRETAMRKEPAFDSAPQVSFPLPPRRPVLTASQIRATVAGQQTAAVRHEPAGENVVRLGTDSRTVTPPSPTGSYTGAATGVQDAPPPVPFSVAGPSDPTLASGGLVGAESRAAPPAELATSSVAAVQDSCPSGASGGCPAAHRWYVGAQLSVAANAVNTFTGPGIDVKAELEKLGSTNLFAGYRSALGTRFEAELFYRRHNLSDVTVNNDGGAGTLLGIGDLDGTTGDGQGHLSMTGMMANVFQDFRLTDSVRPFVGGGIGVARVDVANGGLPTATLVDGDDDVFAYQIGGGVNFALDDRLDLFFEYRYFATNEYDLQYVTGDTVQGKMTSHNLGVGLRYGF